MALEEIVIDPNLAVELDPSLKNNKWMQ